MAACNLLQAAVASVPAIKASLREGAEMDEDEDDDDDEDNDEDEEEDEEELAAVTAQRTAEFAAAVRKQKAKVQLCTCIDSMLQCRHGGCNGSF